MAPSISMPCNPEQVAKNRTYLFNKDAGIKPNVDECAKCDGVLGMPERRAAIRSIEIKVDDFQPLRLALARMQGQ